MPSPSPETPARPGSSGPVDPLLVETEAGRLRGEVGFTKGHRAWRSVPYAAPPVGPLRFAAPQPHAGWAGVRDATANGAAAIQPWGKRTGPLRWWLGARRSRSEDCLRLNVFAPIAGDGTPKPVVVWIHGGSFNSGDGALYDGGALAEHGDVVVVSITYRLGIFGFVDLHDALGEDERIATNPGLRDQLAALEWIGRNIAAFGGDPGRVTIAGESAGSACVTLLMTCARARGLFHGAIAQSGALTLAIDRDDAARTAHGIADELGVSRERPGRLWELPASALLRATIKAQARRSGALVTRPWWDGDLLAPSLAESYAELAPMPLLIGTNLHEHRTFTRTRTDVLPLTRAALAGTLTESLGWDHAARILAEYPETKAGLNDLGSDLVFRMPSVHVAESRAGRAPAWVYRFDHGAGLLGFGAFHAIELLLLFPQPGPARRLMLGPGGPGLEALQERFTDAWLAFVRDGSPGADWPAYDPAGTRTTRIWELEDRFEDDPQPARRAAWAGRDVRIH